MKEAKISERDYSFLRWVEARYRRQVHTIRIPVIGNLSEAGLKIIAEDFHEEYERLYGIGTGLKEAGIELINYGVEVVGHTKKIDPQVIPLLKKNPIPRLKRQAYCNVQRKLIDTAVFEGDKLGAGSIITGPAIIEQPGTTVVILSGWQGDVDKFGNIHITEIIT